MVTPADLDETIAISVCRRCQASFTHPWRGRKRITCPPCIKEHHLDLMRAKYPEKRKPAATAFHQSGSVPVKKYEREFLRKAWLQIVHELPSTPRNEPWMNGGQKTRAVRGRD